MRCSKCGTDNPLVNNFCAKCGNALIKVCAKCVAENSPASNFCRKCGAPLDAAVDAPEDQTPPAELRSDGERRHLTVLFSDLVGSTEISARLDPEEFRELEADYHRAAAEAITQFGGYVAKYLGDGILAYFGWPEAHDNDAEHAARAGLAIVKAVRELKSNQGGPGERTLSVRIGIDSGTVVVAKRGDSESEIFGDTANIASRVQSAAEPDSVIVTPAVNRLVSGLFVVEERGEHQLKGIAEPIELFQIVRLGGARSRLSASAARGLTTFVGREAELRLLWNRWERACDGEGQVVLISGEAGIGKSRLVRQFRERLAGAPHTWNECAGAPYFQNTPFYPVTDMLQQGLAQRGNETDEQKLTELERDLGLAGLKLTEAVPLIARMLNVPVGEKYPPPTLSPEQQRKRLLGTLALWLFATGQAQPLVMAVEDLHWFDASTLELIQLLVEQAATANLMLLCTSRPEFRASWTARAHHTQMTLSRLSVSDVREMVAEVVAQSAMSGETVDQVVERTGGVPLFVEELTRSVLERGNAKPTAREIPATLHDSLLARLDRLGAAKEVVQIASVIGREFSFELLSAVSSMPEHELESALTKLADAELIYAQGIPPEATYQFKHALIQDVAYEALLKSRRHELHRQVAVAMTEKFPTLAAEQLEVLARHWTDAGQGDQAIAAWRNAGDAAFERRAFKEAEETYRRAIEILHTLPESTKRDGLELELLGTFVQVLQVMRGYSSPETAAAAARAQELAEKSNNLEQLVLQVTGSLATVVTRGDLSMGSVLAERLVDLAEHDGGSAHLVTAHVSQEFINLFRGNLLDAEKHFATATSFFDPTVREPPGVAAGLHGYASLTAWLLGRPDTARDRICRALAVAREQNAPFEMAFAQFLSSTLQLLLREPELAEQSAIRSIELSMEHGFPYWAAMSQVALGRARAGRSETDDGIAEARRGLVGLAGLETRINTTLFLSWLAETRLIEGAAPDAVLTIEQALDANPEELAWRPDALRIRGALKLRSGETERAEADFREAITLAQQLSAKAWELRASTSLARLLRDTNRRDEARAILAEIYNWFTEGFDTADLKDAKALLDELNPAG